MAASIEAVVVDLGCLLPGRYERVAAYAALIGVAPAPFVALFAGVTWPESEAARAEVDMVAADNPQFAQALAIRSAADRGEASWAESLASAATAFASVWGLPWDGSHYMRFLASGSGPALHVARSMALVELAARLPVVCVATAPKEMAAPATDLIQLPLPVQVSSDLGVCRPDPGVWRLALAQASPSSQWARTMVVVDLAASIAGIDARGPHPGESWLLSDFASEQRWLSRIAAIAPD